MSLSENVTALATRISTEFKSLRAAMVTKTVVDAKGDLIVASANDVVTRLPAGNSGFVLTVDAVSPVGLSWMPPTGGSGSTSANVVTSANSTANKLTVSSSNTPPSAPVAGDLWVVTNTGVGGTLVSSEAVPFSFAGALTPRTGVFKYPMPWSGTIESVQITAGTPSTGASIIADVNKNGITVYSTQANRPMLAAGVPIATALAPDVTTFVANDYLSVDLDQVGSTAPGSDVMVLIRIRRT